MRLLVTAVFAAAMLALSASVAFAGEITGNGQLKDVNGKSFCAYSGQEDLQWYTNDGDVTLKPTPTKGDPAHSQNWGHLRAALDLSGGANYVQELDWGCNPNLYPNK